VKANIKNKNHLCCRASSDARTKYLADFVRLRTLLSNVFRREDEYLADFVRLRIQVRTKSAKIFVIASEDARQQNDISEQFHNLVWLEKSPLLRSEKRVPDGYKKENIFAKKYKDKRNTFVTIFTGSIPKMVLRYKVK